MQDYLDRTQAYYNVISGFSVRGPKLYIRTNLETDDRHIGMEIYEKLWREIVQEHSEVGLGYVIILDRRGNYLSGGQA